MPYSVRDNISDKVNQKLLDLQAHLTDAGRRYLSAHRTRCYDDARLVSSLGVDKKVINIGGAPYVFEAISSAMGMRCTSVDIDPKNGANIVEALDLDVKQANIERTDEIKRLELGDYDVIVLCEVFEHLRVNLAETIGEIHSQMRNGAILYLTTPNFYFFRNFSKRVILDRSGPPVFEEWSKINTIGYMGHVREYSRTELIHFFEMIGFGNISCSVRNRDSKILPGLKFFPSLFCLPFERLFDRFGQEFVFTLQK
ncbi:class I SAM-dependent methyltransferase [Kordiimonas sp.]|uniref:class I SAM-dependent methyltransferase n=1 Tax=Kordiimonas sp. TaxID=1970157 RepID=UPI003A91C5FF